MISLELSIKHLAWSNQKFFSYFTDKPDSIFGLRSADGEWPIGRLLTHLAGSQEWFRYCLEGTEWTDLKPIRTSQIASEYLQIMADLDQVLLQNAKLPDADLTIKEEENTLHATRSLILAQAVMHSAEHKAEIATILKQHGQHLDLDVLDVWHFVSETK